jgi:MoxR-like ATPase
MLEAMAEGATTIGGERIGLPTPFMVIATQNPIEEEGTYNLPEAQMDRFFMKTVMSYPTESEEKDILRLISERGTDTPKQAQSAQKIDISDIDFLRTCSRRIHVSEQIMKYAVDLVSTTRGAGSHPIKGLAQMVRLGASPRASIALVRVGQAFALMNGRDYVIPEDLKMFAHEILRHRVLLTFEALADGMSSDDIVDNVLEVVPAP